MRPAAGVSEAPAAGSAHPAAGSEEWRRLAAEGVDGGAGLQRRCRAASCGSSGGQATLGGGLARKSLRRGGAGFTELQVTSWVISAAFPTQHGGLVLSSARPFWQFRVVRDGWLRGLRMQI